MFECLGLAETLLLLSMAVLSAILLAFYIPPMPLPWSKARKARKAREKTPKEEEAIAKSNDEFERKWK